LSNVSAGYNGTDVIKDITLSVGSNDNLSIIGPNGCGKTTLLRAIAGTLPFRGEIEIDGQSVRSMKHREVSLRIAMLSQISEVYFAYSVYDTVMMGRYLHISDKLLGLPSKADREQVALCLEAVGLTDDSDKPITTLSGGQLQRVFLARTLAQEPEVILLDEPTNHLDLKYQIELIEYLRTWAEQGNRTVIGVMHDINQSMKLSERIMVMKDGGLKAIGSSGDIITDALMQEVYEVDVGHYMRESLERWRVGANCVRPPADGG